MNSNDFTNLIEGLAKVGSVVSIIVCAVGIVKLIQSRKNGKGGFRHIKTIAGSAFVVFFCVVGIKGIRQAMETSGKYIEQNHPASIANITYGQAIRNVCSNIKWSRIGSESSSNKHSFVQMDADCNYGGKDRKLVIQFDYGIEDFALVDEDTPFEITFVGFDGAQNTNVSDMQDIMYSMFEFYADENGIRLDESMKEGILYTNGASAALASPDDAVDSDTGYNDDASYDTDALSDAGQTYQESAPYFEDGNNAPKSTANKQNNTPKMLVVNQILNGMDGRIRYSYCQPENYDEYKAYPMMVVMPGRDKMWLDEKSAGSNVDWRGFMAWTDLEEDMIVVSPQLTDWGEKSARQSIELTEYFLANFPVNADRVYAFGYSVGGETMSQAVAMRPDLYAAYLHCASKWDGTYAPVAKDGKVAVYIFTAENDEAYGSKRAWEAYDGLRDAYRDLGWSDEQIAKVLKIEIPDNEYFHKHGIYNYHSEVAVLFDDESILEWILVKHK